MTNISKGLRALLADVAEVRAPKVVHQADSTDGTRKWIMEVTGGARVETVLIPDGARARCVCRHRLAARWIARSARLESVAFCGT